MRHLLFVALGLCLSGCASFVNDNTHPLRIETARADGKLVSSVECRLIGEFGEVTVYSGETTLVRRSGRDAEIICRPPGEAEARGRLISRVNGGLAGNIVFGGLIGAVVDVGNAKAYSFPTWIRLTFGKTQVFDRRMEVDGAVLMGAPAEGEATKTGT